jgi:putative ABC transport system permease protein
MNFHDLVRLVLSNLNRMRGRVAMTSMGVVIGTAAIVVLLSLATGLRRSTVENVQQFGGVNQITVFTSARFGGSTSEEEALTPKVLDELAQIDGVVAVTPSERFSGQSTLKYNRLEGFADITGIDPSVVPYMGFEMAQGTDQLNHGTVLIGASVESSFEEAGRSSGGRRGGFGPGMFVFGGGSDQASSESNTNAPDLYNRTVMLEMQRVNDDTGESEKRTVRLRVGGLLESTGSDQDYSIYMSIKDMEDLLTWSRGERPNWNQDGYDQAIVIAEQDTQTMLDVTNEITDRGFRAMSSSSIVESLNSMFLTIEAVLGGVASIALLVAAIGIANTMVMSVLERTREIGLMKAVGARNRDVLAVFLAEAATIGLLGGIVGVIVGIVVSQVIDLFAAGYLSSGGSEVSSVVALPLWLPLFAILFSAVIGLAAGIYPAFRAVQLDPVRALKYE